MPENNKKDRKQTLVDDTYNEYRISSDSKQKYENQWFRIYKMYNGSLDKILNWDKRRPHIFVPKIFPLIEIEAARYIIGLFQTPPFIKCDPRNAIGLENKMSVQTVMEYYLQMAKIFKVMVETVKIVLIYGTVGIVPSWVVKKRKVRKPIYSESSEDKQKSANMMETYEETYRGLEFSVYEPWAIFPFHPFATDENSADAVIVEDYISENFYNQKVKAGEYDNISIKKLRLGTEVGSSIPEKKRQRLGHPQPVGAENLIQRWRRISDDQIITILAQEFLVSELDNPYPFPQKPFIRGIKTYHPKEFFGGDSVKVVEQIQLAMNTLFNQMFAIMAQTIDPVASYRRGSVNPNQIVSFPMQRIGTLDPATDVVFHKPPPLGLDPYNIYKMLSDMFDEATGFFDIKKGALPRQETATGIAVLSQAAEYRTRFDIRVFEEYTLAPLAEMTRLMIKEWMPTNQEFFITGKEPKWETISREQMDGQFAYRCGGSEMTANMTVDREQLLRLLPVLMQLPFLASNQQGLISLVKEIVSYFPVKNMDEIFSSPQQAPNMMEQLLGQPVQSPSGGQTNLGDLLAVSNSRMAPSGGRNLPIG